MGEDNAATLMDSLPPSGWGDVATKQDLEHLYELVQRDMTALRYESRGELREGLAAVRAEVHHELRVQLTAILASQVAMAGLFAAIVKLVVG